MNANSNSIDLSKTAVLLQEEGIQHRFVERLLLTLVAAVGLVGTIFIINNSAMGNQPPSNPGIISAYTAGISQDVSVDDVKKKKLSRYLEIEGSKKAGNELTFSFLRDRLPEGHRYMLDMGDGMRIVLTRDNFTYAYQKPGKYTIELKGVKNAVVTEIAKKTIKIK